MRDTSSLLTPPKGYETMSIQNATAFVQRLNEDSALAQRVQSADDAVRIAGEIGTPFTLEEWAEATSKINGEVSSEDLKQVAGGRILE